MLILNKYFFLYSMREKNCFKKVDQYFSNKSETIKINKKEKIFTPVKI